MSKGKGKKKIYSKYFVEKSIWSTTENIIYYNRLSHLNWKITFRFYNQYSLKNPILEDSHSTIILISILIIFHTYTPILFISKLILKILSFARKDAEVTTRRRKTEAQRKEGEGNGRKKEGIYMRFIRNASNKTDSPREREHASQTR